MAEWIPAVGANRKHIGFKKGEQIFREGETVNGIFFLYSGKAKVHKQWGPDKELIIRFAQKGDLLGHRGFGTQLTYPVSATALEDVTVCFIDMAFFQSSLKVNPAVTYELMLFYAKELQEAERKMRNLAHMDVKGRLADALLELQHQFGKDKQGCINIALTRQDMASFAGTTYETVFRMLQELVKDKLITFKGKNITILNEKKLQLLTGS
jgi:CRP/FNR family transcriptional regulator